MTSYKSSKIIKGNKQFKVARYFVIIEDDGNSMIHSVHDKLDDAKEQVQDALEECTLGCRVLILKLREEYALEGQRYFHYD